jgi:hypothetical protein
LRAVAELRVSEAVVAIAPVETGIARRLTILGTPEESLEGAVHSQYHVLQDLAVNLAVFRHLCFDRRKLGFLLVIADRNAALLPCLAALLDGGIVDMATQHDGTIKHPLLFGSRLQLVFERFANRLPGLLSHTYLPFWFCM